jgi:molybdate transport system regulatory protein
VNRLAGTLVSAESDGAVARMSVNAAGSTITAVLLDAGAPVAAEGGPVTVAFNESETAVGVGTGKYRLSIRNRLPCTVTAVRDDGILCRVELDFLGSPLAALITSESARDLGLAAGLAVEALVKSTEVTVAPGGPR